mmetsp:Transcript_115043/g.229064  ORF Transcript_115043/g.229064 Transcript_115043/m.229064 type:complete len:363 (-) Transcript_115043:151-1239(-)
MDDEHRKWCTRSLVRTRVVLDLDDDDDEIFEARKRRRVKKHDGCSTQSDQTSDAACQRNQSCNECDSLGTLTSLSTSAKAAPKRFSRLRPVAPDHSAKNRPVLSLWPEQPPDSCNTGIGANNADSSHVSGSSSGGHRSHTGPCLPLIDSGAPACAAKREAILEIETPQPHCRGHISRVPCRILCDIATNAGCAIEIARLRSTCWPLRRSLTLLMPALREEIEVRSCLPGLLPHRASLHDFRTQAEIPWKTIVVGLRKLCLWYRVRHRQNQELWRNWEAQRHSYMFGKLGRFNDCRIIASNLEKMAAADREDMQECFDNDLMSLLGIPRVTLAVYTRKNGDLHRRLVQHFTRHATKAAATLGQ